MWKQHYESIFNIVQVSRCDKAYIDLCQNNIDFNTDMTVDAGEMTSIINDLSCNKSPRLDGLTPEHMKYADSQLLVLLSALVSWRVLDASKAFDRVNRQKLITKLTQRDVPKYLSRVICNELNNQSVCVHLC